MGLSKQDLEIAAKQGGYITRAQLISSGVSQSAVDRMVNGGPLTVVSPGLYQIYPATTHVDLLKGAFLALPDPAASHQSAAHLLEFPITPDLEPTVTVASHTTHRFPEVTVRRADDLVPAHLTRVEGLRVTNIARTVFDLGGILEFREFDQIAESLILNGRMKERHLERVALELARRGKPGSRASRDFLDIRSGAHPGSTMLERRGRAVLSDRGLPKSIPQFRVPWDRARRFDDAYPDARLAIEWDSRSWHLQREAMEADRRRDRQAASRGWCVIRFTWADITERPDEIGETVASLLAQRQAS